MHKESYNNSPGRIRMNIMMKPSTGKEFFELASLAVSAINGCELCVTSHEASLIHLASSEQRIWDAIRLSSVMASLDRLVY
jgi:lipoyl-dependent peroxiredoxin subunit D